MPALQFEQTDEPVDALYCPAKHDIQTAGVVAAMTLLAVPLLQNEHAEIEPLPTATLYVPALQEMQNGAPIALHLPAAQKLLHVAIEVAPIALLDDPAAHGVHVVIDVAPTALLHVPAPHRLLHMALDVAPPPVTLLHFPASQGVQNGAPLALHVPTTQSVQDDEPFALQDPDGQDL